MRQWLWRLGVAALLMAAAGSGLLDAQEKQAKKKTASGKPIVAVFRLSGEIPEAPPEEVSLFPAERTDSLKDLVTRLKKAADDPAVKAVVLISESAEIGSAQVEELREAMAGIRAAGKEVYAYADSLSTREYALLSGASRLSVVPTSDVWITGLYGESPYVRGLLDKLGVQPDFLHCGAYKSAAEIFMRKGPSPEAEQMQNWLLDSVYHTFVKLIAKGRGVDPTRVREWIDAGPYTAEKAKAAGIIDAVEQRQDFEAMLKSKYGKDVIFDKKYGKKKAPKLDVSSPFAMLSIWADLLGESAKKKKQTAKSAVGVVYVHGPIVLGGSEPSFFGDQEARSSDLGKALDTAASDDSIKAVVLRIDSPGGSATASEIILDATRRLKAKKPFVVSMGNVAGSGGYYVALAADTIYADAATITASIGVVGGKFATNGLWDKLGIAFKEYKRGAHADILSSSHPFDEGERDRIQSWMNDIYGVFKGHVVASRGKRLKKPIDELAGGRVYTGQQALELGLVDKIGSLQDAVHSVAAQAKLTEYDIRVVPEPKNFIERLLEDVAGEKDEGKGLSAATRASARVRTLSLVDLALPYLCQLDPQRATLVKTALRRMQMLQQEGVLFMMPEMRLGN
jgi:protease-4